MLVHCMRRNWRQQFCSMYYDQGFQRPSYNTALCVCRTTLVTTGLLTKRPGKNSCQSFFQTKTFSSTSCHQHSFVNYFHKLLFINKFSVPTFCHLLVINYLLLKTCIDFFIISLDIKPDWISNHCTGVKSHHLSTDPGLFYKHLHYSMINLLFSSSFVEISSTNLHS